MADGYIAECVVRNLIDRAVREFPERTFAVFGSGAPPWSYRDMHDAVLDTARQLQGLGVRQDDHVLCWLPNGRDGLRFFLAINYIGAVYVPLNLAYKGTILQHVIKLSGARVAIVHADLLGRLADVERADLQLAVVVGGTPPASPLGGVQILAADALQPNRELAPLVQPIRPWSLQMILMTSGTTGLSKGVLVSYSHMYGSAIASVKLTSADRGLLFLPMFHLTGITPVLRALGCGGSVAVLERFRTETFWQDVRRCGATQAVMTSSVVSFLNAQPRSEDEVHTTLKHVIVQLNAASLQFVRRLGIAYHTHFNMTEVSNPLVSEPQPVKLGVCGRPRQGVQCRIVDENDCELPRGAIGELVLRMDEPWTMMSGYHGDPAATARAWRNGWFHTGDAFRQDEDGDYFIVDRIKDVVRRRGENVSSYEVESQINAHPDVTESAVIGVASPHGDEDLMCVVQPVAGRTVDPAQLIAWLGERLPHFMVPRYVRLMPDLPRTPTEKVQKTALRQTGVTPDTWDRERAGIRIAAQKIGESRLSA